ncbi:DUF3644 domain-containing protein [Legionella brunensis]|uniref:DUF3644 domain-containing protein n=1 Tax=Legionella brunensis TaxID=29422 RepID=A0A0W0S372_9GAMM|nr:DUF3644 domain-containing protein [Legionella brunensis]KTC77983.1 hypothetical protein Lbru_2275 [Legionella brunensis]
MSKTRDRKVSSIKSELVKKSREAVLAAVQIFNNPNISFKSESYIILMIIGWTYLLHAYYRGKGIEYRYHKESGKRRQFEKTKHGADKYWELECCLNEKYSPVDKDTTNNLKFLIGLRHEIEHRMTSRIDDLLSARLQACCLNYNKYLKQFFGDKLGIEHHLSFSLQFSSIGQEHIDLLKEQRSLPKHILSYIANFDELLSLEEFSSQQYAYRIIFVTKLVNRKGQADRLIEFVKSDSSLAKNVNKEYAAIKETEKTKYLPAQIVALMKNEGYSKFKINNHTDLWKKFDAKNPAKGFGTMVANKQWHYYDAWVDIVRKHCKDLGSKYK